VFASYLTSILESSDIIIVLITMMKIKWIFM